MSEETQLIINTIHIYAISFFIIFVCLAGAILSEVEKINKKQK